MSDLDRWESEGGMYEYEDDDENRPVVIDVNKTSMREQLDYTHIHHIDGTCVKNRYGRCCDER
jgi:hypothetical protein